MATVEKIIKWGVAYSLWSFSPENAGTAWQVLTKTATWYSYADAPVKSVNGQTGDVTIQSWSEASWVTTTQPSNPVAWSTYYDTTAWTLKVYNWTAWVEVGWGNVIAMTQAQYDALPEATKNDGKLRIITDATGIEMADKAYVDWLVGDVESLLAAI